MGAPSGQELVSYLRTLLFALWGISMREDPAPRVLIER